MQSAAHRSAPHSHAHVARLAFSVYCERAPAQSGRTCVVNMSNMHMHMHMHLGRASAVLCEAAVSVSSHRFRISARNRGRTHIHIGAQQQRVSHLTSRLETRGRWVVWRESSSLAGRGGLAYNVKQTSVCASELEEKRVEPRCRRAGTLTAARHPPTLPSGTQPPSSGGSPPAERRSWPSSQPPAAPDTTLALAPRHDTMTRRSGEY